jgi:hypothetical protein
MCTSNAPDDQTERIDYLTPSFAISEKSRKISLSHTFCFRYGLHRGQSPGFQEYIAGMPDQLAPDTIVF